MNIIQNQIKTFFNYIHLLQEENYNLQRFLRVVAPILFQAPQEREERTVWTDKLIIVVTIAVLLHFSAAYMVGWILSFFLPLEWFFQPFLIAVVFIILMSVSHIFLVLATMLIWPIDYLAKRYVIEKARRMIIARPDLTIVGIAGSYGKTTMKEVVSAGLSGSKNVLRTRENFNTPIAIARMILSELTDEIDVLVVEMGEYEQGDVKKIAELTPPTIAIVTGINETHLERMKTTSIITTTIFEVVQYAQKGAHIILNADDETVMEHYDRFSLNRPVHFYSLDPKNEHAEYVLEAVEHDTEDLSLTLTLSHSDREHTIHTRIIGEYVAGPIQATLIVGDILSVPTDALIEKIEVLERLHRRLEIVRGREGVVIVDDTYNANADSAIAGLRAVKELYKDKKLTLVLGDMLELGKATEEHHRRVGAFIAEEMNPEKILLVGEYVESLASEAKDKGLTSKKIRIFKTVSELMRSDVDWWGKEVVYVKGSNGIKLNKLVDALRERRGLEE